MNREISNSADILDSRDIIKRIEELTDELGDVQADIGGSASKKAFDDWLNETAADNTHTFQDAANELLVLKRLEEEASGSPDWPHGESLIRDSYFEDYARELADDIGAVKSDASWPNSFIDWKAAAEALQQDYTSVDFDGVTYWIRS